MRVKHSQHQHRGAVRTGPGQICPAIEQRSRRPYVTAANREHERRDPRARLRVEVSPSFGQQLHRPQVALRRGPHQGGLLPDVLARAHVRVIRHQPLHDVGVAAPGRYHQHGFAAGPAGRIGVAPGAQQRLHDPGMAILRRQPDRHDVVPVRRRHIGSRVDQSLQQFDVAMMRRPVQRRRAVRLRRGDVDALAEQDLDRLLVHPRDRIDQWAIPSRRSGAQRDAGPRQHDDGQHETPTHMGRTDAHRETSNGAVSSDM